MPAELPPSSGYTYAVDLTVDEALAMGAEHVRFEPEAALYLENFLELPVGWQVPSARYDATAAAWVPTRDGRVVRVLAVTEGRAALDISGSGAPATAAELAALGVTDGELRRVGAT